VSSRSEPLGIFEIDRERQYPSPATNVVVDTVTNVVVDTAASDAVDTRQKVTDGRRLSDAAATLFSVD